MASSSASDVLRPSTPHSPVFPRQFVLAGEAVPMVSEDWHHLDIGYGMRLQWDPALNVVTRRAEGKGELTVLGHMLDASAPGDDDVRILDRLLTQADTLEGFFRLTAPVGGRWILIFRSNGRLILCPDAGALRSVYYHVSANGIVCAAQPGHIAAIVRLQLDDRAMAFAKTRRLESGVWPGDLTPVSNVRRLYPNHYLDLRSGKSIRFWPWGHRGVSDAECVVAQSACVLGSLWRSAVNRFGNVALPVTAGYDSRVLLAASRSVAESVHYFVVHGHRIDSDHPDIRVPVRLASRLGIPFTVHELRKLSIDPYMDGFLRANILARADNAGCMYTKFPTWPKGISVIVSGLGNEVVRCFFRRSGFRPDPITMAVLFNMPINAYVCGAIQEWLNDAMPSALKNGYDIADLCYWELRLGGRCALALCECDYDHDTLPIFNCRQYLDTMLGASADLRAGPRNRILRKLIQRLWPECLAEPINPAYFRATPEGLAYLVGAINNIVPIKPAWVRIRRWMSAASGRL